MSRYRRFAGRWMGRLALLSLLSALGIACPAQAPSVSLGQDARLEQPLELSVAGVPLRALFQRIQKQTGVSLQVDAALADYSAIVYAPNRPLRELMTHLASAFHAEWRTDTQQPPTYTLHPVPPTGESPRKRFVREQLRDLPRRLKALYEPPAEATPDDDEHLQHAMAIYQQEFRKSRLPLRLLGRLTPAEIEALQTGKTLEFSSRTDPRFDPSWLAEWKPWLDNTIGYLAEENQAPKGDPILAEYYVSVRGLARGDEVRLRLSCDPETAAIECAVGLFAQGELIYGETFVLEAEPPDPEGFSERDFTVVLPKDHPWREVQLAPLNGEDERQAPAGSVPPARAVRVPKLPSLDGDWFAHEAQVVLQIAQAVGKPFVAEYDWALGSIDAVNQLSSFAYSLARSGYEWLVSDGWVVMRYQDPYEARSKRIPAHARQRWFFKPNRRGVITIQDLIEMARYIRDANHLHQSLARFGVRCGVVASGELPYLYVVDNKLLGLPQVHHGLLYAVDSLEFFYEVPEAFRVLTALTEAQRRALLAGQAVRLERLTPQALLAVYELAYYRDKARAPAFWQDTPPTGTLRLVSRERQVRWLQLPPHLTTKARDAESAYEIWAQLEEQLHYDPEALYRKYATQLCCERVYTLEVDINGFQRRFVLLKDYTPLLQRNPSLRTPK